MTDENKKKVHDAIWETKSLMPTVKALQSTLCRIARRMTSRGGFEGDYVVDQAAEHLIRVLSMLESAYCGFISKLESLDKLVNGPSMSSGEAVKILKDMQKWRRGEGSYAFSENPLDNKEPPHTSSDFGLAIDYAISAIEKKSRSKNGKQQE